VNRFPRVPPVVPGYDPDEVDALIKRIEATLGKGVLEGEPVTADELRAARFRVRLGGYNEIAVDYALEAFIIAVENKDVPPRRAESAGTAGRMADPDAERAPAPPRDPHPPERRPPEAAHAAAPRADASGTSGPEARAVPDRTEDARRAGTALPPWPVPPQEPGRNGAAAAPPWPATPAAPPEPAGTVPRADDTEAGTAEPGSAAAGGGSAEAAGTRREPGPDAAAAEADAAVGGTGGADEEWFERQARRVEKVIFRPGRFGLGYSEAEVDAFLDRIVATLRRTTDEPLTADDVREVKFSTVLFRPGYAIDEVDEFLAEMAEVIAKR